MEEVNVVITKKRLVILLCAALVLTCLRNFPVGSRTDPSATNSGSPHIAVTAPRYWISRELGLANSIDRLFDIWPIAIRALVRPPRSNLSWT